MPAIIPYLWLITLGAGWGATLPLTKVAVSTGYGHFGLIFWQAIIGILVLGVVQLIRRRTMPLGRAVWFYVAIAFIGTLIPNTASFQAMAVLPSGIVSILLSIIPMLAFPIALGLGVDRFSLRRFAGLTLGLGAVLMIVGLPDALPDAAMLAFIPIGLIAPMMYAFEGNFVARWGTGGAGPLQLLLGASVVAAIVSLPLAVGTGQFIDPRQPWGAPEWALVGSSVIHAVVYSTYVHLIRLYGSVFSVQVSYLVTTFGLIWAMVFLGERYSGPIWLALGLMFAGIYLVRPRKAQDGRDPISD